MKMEYYDVVKKGYLVERDNEKERNLVWLQKCEKQRIIPIPAFIKIKD
jgi:hypothetical protein